MGSVLFQQRKPRPLAKAEALGALGAQHPDGVSVQTGSVPFQRRKPRPLAKAGALGGLAVPSAALMRSVAPHADCGPRWCRRSNGRHERVFDDAINGGSHASRMGQYFINGAKGGRRQRQGFRVLWAYRRYLVGVSAFSTKYLLRDGEALTPNGRLLTDGMSACSRTRITAAGKHKEYWVIRAHAAARPSLPGFRRHPALRDGEALTPHGSTVRWHRTPVAVRGDDAAVTDGMGARFALPSSGLPHCPSPRN